MRSWGRDARELEVVTVGGMGKKSREDLQVPVTLREPGGQHALWYASRHHTEPFVAAEHDKETALLVERNGCQHFGEFPLDLTIGS